MNLEIIVIVWSAAAVLVNKLLSPSGLLAFIPILINRYLPSFLSTFFNTLLQCTVCVSGWIMIAYSIYLFDYVFAIKNVPVVMALAYYMNKIDIKLSF